MSNFELVIGNAASTEGHSVVDSLFRRVRPRLYSTPKTEEYDLAMPSKSPLARLRRWRNRELNGPRMRMGLWLEAFGSEPSSQVRLDLEKLAFPPDGCPRSHVRIDLRLSCLVVPRRCRLLMVNDKAAQFWSYHSDKTSFVSVQLPEYVVYPATSNYVGIVEWQWSREFDLSCGGIGISAEAEGDRDSGLFEITYSSDFTIKYKLYSGGAPVASGELAGKMAEGQW